MDNLVARTTSQCSERPLLPHLDHVLVLRLNIKRLKHNGIRSIVKTTVDVRGG